MVERHECGSAIAAATTQPSLHWNALAQFNGDSWPHVTGTTEQMGGAQGEVRVRLEFVEVADTLQRIVTSGGEGKSISERDGLHHRGKLMVAVLARAEHVEG